MFIIGIFSFFEKMEQLYSYFEEIFTHEKFVKSRLAGSW